MSVIHRDHHGKQKFAPASEVVRQELREAKRVIVKIGSRVLVQRTGNPDLARIRSLVKQIARLRNSGREVVLVTSGAIAAGVEALRLGKRPSDLPQLQMAAAVGQVRLMTLYDTFFEAERCGIGQVLLTHADLQDRARHLNARNTILALLRQGIIPIINENDVVAVDEIKFGDNDVLASLVTVLVDGDVLILLSTTDGLRAPTSAGRSRRVPHLGSVTPEALALAWGKAGDFSMGGMASKLKSAQTAVAVGAKVVIADGRKPEILDRVMSCEDVGTLIGASSNQQSSLLRGRKRWLAFFHRANGFVVVDAGAQRAIEERGHSLLPIGIRDVEGTFARGSLVNIRAQDGRIIARGLTEYSSEEIRRIMGRRTNEIESILGSRECEEVIHRDNMVNLAVTGGDAK
jgi:glutamate 5-kinase